MVEKRFVTINPEFFKSGSNRTTRKNRAPSDNTPRPQLKVKEPKPTKEKNAKTIKKNLLNYIRQQQQKNYDEMIKPRRDGQNTKSAEPQSIASIDTTAPSDFKDSLDYLMKLTKENENKHRHNYTIKNHPHITNENVSMSLPLEFITPPPPPMNSSPVHIHPPRPPQTYISPPPQYGCLKNGSLPTYRDWKNKTQKNYGSVSMSGSSQTVQSTNNTPMAPITSMKDKLLQEKIEELKKRSVINPLASTPSHTGGKLRAQINYGKKLEQEKNAKKRHIPKRQKTLRRTYRVGRSKIAPKVSVLVSNKTIRKNIYTQALLLKQTPIKEVKRYLIKHGFIRVGSIAPNDILRRMYENARLVCGELRNHNPDNLLYNFLNGNEEN